MMSITLQRPTDYSRIAQHELEQLAMYALDSRVRVRADAELARRERAAVGK